MEKQPITQNNRSFGLDLIRAIAIVLVLISHFVHKLEVLGFWGVELFFVLSGFLIGQILWRNYEKQGDWTFKDISNFWYRRWWRTLPNYYLFLIVTILFAYFMSKSIPHWKDLSSYLWFSQNLVSHDGSFYGVSWSLCIEEFFYLLFPLVLFIISKVINNKQKAFIMTLSTFVISSIIIRGYLAQNDVYSIRTITLARLDSICYGVIIAFLQAMYVLNPKVKRNMFMIGSCALFALITIISIYKISFVQMINSQVLLLIVPISVALLLPYSAVAKPTVAKLSFINDSITNLSLWSYSIYLSHIPVLFTVYYLTDKFRGNATGNLLSKILGLSLTIIISALLFKYFETPITKMRPKEIIKVDKTQILTVS